LYQPSSWLNRDPTAYSPALNPCLEQVTEKGSGRIIASGTLSKMQPREEDPTQKVRL